MEDKDQAITILSSRQLVATELHERNNKVNKKMGSNSQQCDHLNTSGKNSMLVTNVASSTNNQLSRPMCHFQNNNAHLSQGRLIQNEHLSPDRLMKNNKKAFDTTPFYNRVKAHVTTHKRVRYKHLVDSSRSKALPRDRFDEPLVYQRDMANKITVLSPAKKKTPISLNPILPMSECDYESDRVR